MVLTYGIDMKEKVISFLTDNGIPFTVKEHPAVYTMAEMEALGLNDLGPIPKNLFIRDGKGKQHFLITAAMDTAIDMKQLGEILGAKKLGFASADRLSQYLGVTPGCVSPFGVLQDQDHAVTVVFDRKLSGLPLLGVHPNVHDATVWLSFADLQKAMELTGHEVRIVDFENP